MSLGQNSIAKRVAKPTETAKTAPAVQKSPAKKPTVKTATITNIAPETVEKVTGHKEQTAFAKIPLGKSLPSYLL